MEGWQELLSGLHRAAQGRGHCGQPPPPKEKKPTCCFPHRLCSLPLALGVRRLERAGKSSGLTLCDPHVRKVDEGCTPTPKPTLGLY